MTRGHRSATASSERPEAFHGTTQRDIHVSQKGQARPPEGPNTATRISVWRPIPEQTTIQPAPALDDNQLALQAELKAYVEKELVLPTSDPYAKWEKAFLDRPDTYPRYLRASKFDLQEAKTRIKGTLEWRRSYKPDLIPPTEIAEEAEGGKVVVNGFDIQGRPIVWLRPSRENTKPSPTQVRHLIWQLERAIDIMPPGVEKLALVVDYKGANTSNNPPMSTAKEVISILQNHYCERLGRAVVINVPWYLNSFFSVLKPFLDPRTKDKIKFNPELTDLVVNEQLDEEFGGQHAFFYDHRVYMPALCSYCGIKEDGTRVEKVPKDQPETRPEELQRKLTSQVDESDRLAAEARAEIEKQEAQNAPAAQDHDAASNTAISEKQLESVLENGHVEQASKGETAALAGGAGAAVAAVAGGTAVAAAAHAKPTDYGQSEVMRILAAQNGGSSVPAQAVSAAPQVEPVPVREQTVPDVDSKATEPERSSRAAAAPEPISVSAPAPAAVPAPAPSPAPALAPAPRAATTPAHSATSASAISPEPTQNGSAVHAEKQAPAVETTKQQEGKSSIQERSIPTPAPAKASKPASEKPKGFKKLLAMCGCAPSGAKQAFDDTPQSKAVPSEKAAAPAPVAEPAVLPAEPSRNKVKIADDAAASKPTTNVPLATNATFGPEAYQTALEGPEVSDDYFAQGDLRKVHPMPHDASEKDHAKTVLKPEALMQRLHTGGSGDLVLAFEVKQPPQDAGAGNETAEADGEATSASK